MAATASARKTRGEPAPGAPPPRPPIAAPKRDAILRAAIDVFAERGYFNAQVADVARAAGVAAGTVYLYFRSKDDLLISIFERGMNDALADGRALAEQVRDPRERLRRIAKGHLARIGRDRNMAGVLQVEPPQATKFMARFSNTLLREYLGLIRDAIAEGQHQGLLRDDIKPTVAAKMLFGALDEMATNWILSTRKYSLDADADAVIDLFLNGAR